MYNKNAGVNYPASAFLFCERTDFSADKSVFADLEVVSPVCVFII